MSNIKYFKILSEIHQCLCGSQSAYRHYIESGKKYRWAVLIKVENTKALHMLKTHGNCLPQEAQAHVNELIEHYTVWTRNWDQHARANATTDPEAIFDFSNDVPFPRHAEFALNALYRVRV